MKLEKERIVYGVCCGFVGLSTTDSFVRDLKIENHSFIYILIFLLGFLFINGDIALHYFTLLIKCFKSKSKNDNILDDPMSPDNQDVIEE